VVSARTPGLLESMSRPQLGGGVIQMHVTQELRRCIQGAGQRDQAMGDELLGAEVDVAVLDPSQMAYVVGSEHQALVRVLQEQWPASDVLGAARWLMAADQDVQRETKITPLGH
jgi:hypothetical protein